MTLFFSSDHHFSHENILKYCNRPFSTIQEHDEILISNWNSVVKQQDIVFHLGDFCLGDDMMLRRYLTRLSGKIFFVIPEFHHDKRWIKAIDLYTANNQAFIYPALYALETRFIGIEVPIILCHYPLARWDRMHYGAWMLHGHAHGRYSVLGLIYDVGVDSNKFTPISYEELKEIMSKKEISYGYDQKNNLDECNKG